MKKINNIINKAKQATVNAAAKVSEVLQNKRGEGYTDTAIKIIISVVIGGLLLAGLYLLFNGTVIPQMTNKISGFFNYSGT